ncbi:hypothetical protein EGT67_17525 [Prescottella agglutinans]|uniref:Uncharacterized protein n=1 Tax=Prescottella agglutinans TaxID=1644129 RepID=A0A3S3BCK6_9NOCA|nr:hypothetical protein EGT67_17525 [Prescottella agglutinans]
MMSCIMPIAAVKSVIHDEPAMVWVASGMAMAFASATVGLSGIAGFRYLKLSKRIAACQDTIGPGIAIPSRKHLVPILVCLGSVSLGGLVVAAGWFFGADVGPLAAQDRGQAQFLTVFGVVALAFFAALLGFRSSKEIRLYPSGIQRMVTLRRLWSTRTVDTFVSWDDIVEFEVDELVVGGTIEVRNPIIWLVSGTEIPVSSRLRFDESNRLRLDAYLLLAEPNVLLGLLSSLRESPDRRRVLADAAARELLAPPPLRSRLWPASSAPVSAGESEAS